MEGDSLTIEAQAAVFAAAGRRMDFRAFPLPDTPEPGAVICRVRLATICGSDLHTIQGRRTEPTPLVLGHEIVGEVVALGAGVTHDYAGASLAVGDRVSWTIMAHCGDCFYCARGLPQKCKHLKKYGHACCDDAPGCFGGYGDHCYLWPGTAIFQVPQNVSDPWAAPANCALSTVIHAIETIGSQPGERVLIQGAGLLGLNLVALLREAGAAHVTVTDVNPARRVMAERFGADAALAPDDVLALREAAGVEGFDVAYEVCGHPGAIPQAIETLRTGGRYLVAGLVMPGSTFEVDGNVLTRKCLTLRGIHNYRPENLGAALRFLSDHGAAYPYGEVVGAVFPLKEIEAAVECAASGKFIRVGVRP
jgi:putative phosphonate catabolism associated alcohol dehydrogenase